MAPLARCSSVWPRTAVAAASGRQPLAAWRTESWWLSRSSKTRRPITTRRGGSTGRLPAPGFYGGSSTMGRAALPAAS